MMSNHDLAMMFFLQLAFILAVVRSVGWLARFIGQPHVVGEMIAGVLIGPSLLGLLFPEWQAQLFPKQSVSVIYVVSQVGLVLYMFLIGVEFNLNLLHRHWRSAVSISLAGILVPFLLGGLLAYLVLDNQDLFGSQVTPYQAILFLGAAMSITAFPMLARIIYEHGLSQTKLGTLALAAGSMDDAVAWCLLAIVLASFGGEPRIAFWAIGGGLFYAVVILFVVKPRLQFLKSVVKSTEKLTGATIAFILMGLMLGAWFTDYVGIYAVFGAFIFGVAIPRGNTGRRLDEALEPVATNFLLPLFFIYSGLNTHLELLLSPTLWGLTLMVVLFACLGKGIACWAVARWHGENNHEAMAIGTLMNARGLMELILLNIGLAHGVITPTLFTIMVIMAIVTTLMASPIFKLIYRYLPKPTPEGEVSCPMRLGE